VKAENKNEFHEAGLLHLDNAKARTKLGWAPLMNSMAAVKTTIDWYKDRASATWYVKRNYRQTNNRIHERDMISFNTTEIKDVFVIDNFHSEDIRGTFVKTYNSEKLEEAGFDGIFRESYYSSRTRTLSGVCIFKYRHMIMRNWYM
jgi:hypothetical protein